jgi:hypothetical protein
MRMRTLVAVPFGLTLVLLVALASPASRLESAPNDPVTIRDFVTAVNNGDMAAAFLNAAPSIAFTLPGGQTIAFTQSTPLPASLLPIAIVSLTPEGQGSQTVDCVFTFGSDPTKQQVQIKGDISGDAGVIVSIKVIGPAS